MFQRLRHNWTSRRKKCKRVFNCSWYTTL